LVHVGDDIILGQNNSHLQRLVNVFLETRGDAAFLVEKVEDPRQYGVISGTEVRPGTYEVLNIVEKPKEPRRSIAIVGVYAFTSRIFEAIEKVEPDESGEVQLTDAIMNLIADGRKVYAIELIGNERRIDIGTPASYWNALKETLQASTAV
jgi:dTDP-glucose pyrophosphorylase